MPHFFTSLQSGVNEMTDPKMSDYKPTSDFTRLRSWIPEQASNYQYLHDPEDPTPIEIYGHLIPSDFGMRIYFESFSTKGLEWCVSLQIHIGLEGIPKTTSIEVFGDGQVEQKFTGEVVYTNVDRIERTHIEFVTKELRRLEALSVKLAAETWRYNTQLAAWGWVAADRTNDKSQAQKRLKSLEREIMNRVSYRKIDDIFLRRIAQLFLEGQRKGISPYRYIADQISREDSPLIKLKTVQRWVTNARKKGILPAPTSKKVSATKAESKKTITKKKG